MTAFEIFFNDLNPQAKAEYMSFRKVSNPRELNHENIPIASIETEEENNVIPTER